MESYVTRRTFFTIAAAAAAGAGLHWWKPAQKVAAAGRPPSGGPVTIVEFSDSGQRLKKEKLPKVVKTDAEWKQQLSPGAYDITRHADTEIAYTGSYWNLHDRGLFRCICCDTALFSSETKFDSGTGWPSFWDPIARENISVDEDRTLGMVRNAVSCKLCDAHLGHVFDDGPKPTGLRYCMNSASLRFVKA